MKLWLFILLASIVAVLVSLAYGRLHAWGQSHRLTGTILEGGYTQWGRIEVVTDWHEVGGDNVRVVRWITPTHVSTFQEVEGDSPRFHMAIHEARLRGVLIPAATCFVVLVGLAAAIWGLRLLSSGAKRQKARRGFEIGYTQPGPASPKNP